MADNEEKLVKMLKYVSEHNDFYKKRIKDYGITNPLDITQWPILTRKELQENRYNMFSDGYKRMYFSQQLRRQSSSGSSGIPINVYWNVENYHKSTLSLWRKREEYYSILPKDKMIKFTLETFGLSNTGKNIYARKENDNIISISRACLQNEYDYRKVIKIINEFAPIWIYIQPYILKKLLLCYKKFDIVAPKSIRYIESVGEILPSKLKNDASAFFAAPVANMYGSEEHNGIAIECPEHNMHILTDNVYCECKSSDTIGMFGEGEAIITNLYNEVMPLIRYKQGDIINIEKLKQTCQCGYRSSIISVIKGRTHDCITVDGAEINSFTLLEVIDEVNNIFKDPITEFKYIYSISKKKLTCYIAIIPEIEAWKTNIVNQIEETFWSKTSKDIHVIFEVRDIVSVGSTHKKFKILEFED